MGPECSNNHKGRGLCIIASRHPLQLRRVLNNTEVKDIQAILIFIINLMNLIKNDFQAIIIYILSPENRIYRIYIYRRKII